MFDLVHAMRARIMQSPAFDGDHIVGTILFADTIDRDVGGLKTATYLWSVKGIVPFLKVDKGLVAAADGVRRLAPIPGLADTLARAREAGVLGTKTRSFILEPDAHGIEAIVDRQFAVAASVMAAGLMPIIEPDVDIHSPEREKAEHLLREALGAHLDGLAPGQRVILNLSLPVVADFYSAFVGHPKVVRVLALSGGYSRTEALDRLRRNHGVIASFARAFFEGLSVTQSQPVFDRVLAETVREIYDASVT
jgi:fructose-bisphosphate aldolase, class I